MVTVLQLLAQIGGAVKHGHPDTALTGVAGIERAGSGQLSFIANKKYSPHLKTTAAAAVIVPEEEVYWAEADETSPTLIAHREPYYAFMLALRIFNPEKLPAPGIDPTASLGEEVRLADGVHLGRNVVLDDGVQLGEGCRILAGCYVGRGAKIGPRTTIGPNVTVMHDCELGARVRIHPGSVIGADGFGYARLDNVHHKIPQVGKVVIEDDVELGACVCIDRATMGETRIKQGAKIDNLVQIAHNVQIGERTIIISQVGISGSTKVGNDVILAGQAGMVGHLEIGDGAIIAAQSGISHSIDPGKKMLGSPARELGLEKRLHVLVGKLPQMSKRLKELERRLAELEKAKKE